jgi:hypothetical protein
MKLLSFVVAILLVPFQAALAASMSPCAVRNFTVSETPSATGTVSGGSANVVTMNHDHSLTSTRPSKKPEDERAGPILTVLAHAFAAVVVLAIGAIFHAVAGTP